MDRQPIFEMDVYVATGGDCTMHPGTVSRKVRTSLRRAQAGYWVEPWYDCS